MIEVKNLHKNNNFFVIQLGKLQVILYTKKPDFYIFQLLIEQGEISIDHLIKKDKNGKVIEKGPLFKISKKGFTVLFPEPIEYSLN